ncbi:methylamine utilization protein MauF [Methyloceanibacter sp.]|uniref:methylamine utilization protein MauF n=1 Tax=Methyloceanibacter sp. TaxID=1965321 RepID=UPI002086B642|nr:methylamine utilization protein MauF [Methyloceanibacter sp.]GFO82815.1 MAG: hypothetical protein A49_24420 [Methyloceanibacter sp.]HML91081.1 methylamine utilization protein MauF [Methyloceanibacter sp.]
MAQAESVGVAFEGGGPDQGQAFIADAIVPGARRTSGLRYLTILLAAAAGAGVAALLSPTSGGVILLLCALAFTGGLLSTWSPCGYSSLSLLRVDSPHDLRAVMRWIPTMAAHGVGYVVGGLLLAFVLAGAAWLLPVQGFNLSHDPAPWALIALGSVCLLYGLHQLKIIRMPYPQLRAQVSHGARMDLPKWATGLLYGGHLGLNFATYVMSPILYIVVLASLLSGSLQVILALVFSLNLGRFLPLLVNLLPVPDWSVQRWMAKHDGGAVLTDAAALVFSGSLLLVSVLIYAT